MSLDLPGHRRLLSKANAGLFDCSTTSLIKQNCLDNPEGSKE